MRTDGGFIRGFTRLVLSSSFFSYFAIMRLVMRLVMRLGSMKPNRHQGKDEK